MNRPEVMTFKYCEEVKKSEDTKYYFVCATARSGSSYFCDGLSSTGLVGKPNEYLLHSQWWKDVGINAYIKMVSKEKRSNNVVGIKFMWFSFQRILDKIERGFKTADREYKIFEKIIPYSKYIYLTRRDKVRQAISYYKASKTGVWFDKKSEINEKEKRTNTMNRLKFNFFSIEFFLQTNLNYENEWIKYFQRNSITPLNISYEELDNDFNKTIIKALKYIGVDTGWQNVSIKSELERLSDNTTEDWCKRYYKWRKFFWWTIPIINKVCKIRDMAKRLFWLIFIK